MYTIREAYLIRINEKSRNNEAQLVPIGIPVVCCKTRPTT